MYADFENRKIDMVSSGILPLLDPDYWVEYSYGNTEFGFVYFYSPVELDDCSGRNVRPAGTGIFYLPRQPRFFRAMQGSLQHTWFMATGPGIGLCLEKYGIPTFSALELPEITFLETYINGVRHEGLHRDRFYDDAVTDLSWDFFRRVGVLLAQSDTAKTQSQERNAKTLREIRLCVHSDVSRRWTVSDMAALHGLNTTRFAMDYRMQFDASPIDDLIDARLKRAEYMLTHLSYTVKHIASECGFNSTEHFTRLFHAKRGCPPGQFRRS